MVGPIGVVTISAFALPYLYLRRKERKNSEAFDTYYIRFLELERAREKNLAGPVTRCGFLREATGGPAAKGRGPGFDHRA
ncbi:hypothetical protein HNQ71_003490 [Mesorhizobium sangaii]|uniref:Uncharacterized protein n=1 Tax=Mesorhizobium sangaii TaxID=505389 RepID=A0A841P6M2_9HYPH|nr:hypothetical protein [Mesorhizobium sangaii]